MPDKAPTKGNFSSFPGGLQVLYVTREKLEEPALKRSGREIKEEELELRRKTRRRLQVRFEEPTAAMAVTKASGPTAKQLRRSSRLIKIPKFSRLPSAYLHPIQHGPWLWNLQPTGSKKACAPSWGLLLISILRMAR